MQSTPQAPAPRKSVIRSRSSFGIVNGILFAAVVLLFSFIWNTDYLWLEALLVMGVLLATRFLNISAVHPPSALRRISRQPFLACAIPAALSVVLRLALLPWVPVPNPVVPDEFSHLFLAKTFLSGRLANPGHPMWQYFESIHILSLPTTFSSMYPPGQACFLALGKLLTGEFFAGVLLGTAFFCAALTWFLRSCVPPGWALYGGVLAAIRVGASSYWNNSYWGGSVPAAGGALLLGAYWRLRRRWTVEAACIFAIGTVILANTRPYEGAGVVAALTIALLYEAITKRTKLEWPQAAAAVLATCVILGFAGFLMTREWKAVTGNALTMPYQLNQKVYGWPMTVPWFHPQPVAYRHKELELYHNWEIEEHELITDPKQIPLGVLIKLSFFWRFFFGIALSSAVLFARQTLSTPRFRVLWLCVGFVLLQVFTEQSGYPHYSSSIAAGLFLFVIQGLRRVSHVRWGAAPVGKSLVFLAIPIFAVILSVRAVAHSPTTQPSNTPNYLSWCCTDARQRDRTRVTQELERKPGKHLVLVSYDLSSYDTFEWVYNEPDPENSKIVFARDMGPEGNHRILEYYRDRTVWSAFIKDKQARLLLTPSQRGANPENEHME